MLRTTGQKISGPGAGIAIICFFLPWVLVSCNDRPIASMSGWQFAVGGTIQTGFGTEAIPGNPLILLALLAGIGVFAVLYFAGGQKYSIKKYGSVLIGLGALPLLILFLRFAGMKEQAAQEGFTVQFEYGLWGVVVGYVVVVFGGILDWIEGEREITSSGQVPTAEGLRKRRAQGIAGIGVVLLVISLLVPWVQRCVGTSFTCTYLPISGFDLIVTGAFSVVAVYAIAFGAYWLSMAAPETTIYSLLVLAISPAFLIYANIINTELPNPDQGSWGIYFAFVAILVLASGLTEYMHATSSK